MPRIVPLAESVEGSTKEWDVWRLFVVEDVLHAKLAG
jgi:hypothetical protein